jgi:TrmH family RNA methyltransferase
MLSKNELKYYAGLLQRKKRDSERKFIVEGKRLLDEALKSKFDCEILCCTNQFYEQYSHQIKTAKDKNIRVEIIPNKDLQKLCDTKSPQGIIGIFEMPSNGNNLLDLIDDELIVALDNIRDPGNLGTIIRTCNWFGISSIILSESCVELFNPKVVRSSMGSIFNLTFLQRVNLKQWLPEQKDKFEILAADLTGTSIRDYDLSNKSIILFSSEAHGIDNELLPLVDEKITIKGKGNAESLNVASAAAIILENLTQH